MTRAIVFLALLFLLPLFSHAQNSPVSFIELKPDEGLSIRSADISRDGNYIITGALTTIVWNADTGAKLREIDIRPFLGVSVTIINVVGLSKDKRYIITGDYGTNVFASDFETR